MKQAVSAKEELFCTYYCLGRNGREAAAKSGYRHPEKTALRLLAKPALRARIEALDAARQKQKADIAAGYARLAFGCITDAVRLLFSEGETLPDLDHMDLFLISDIKKQKGGGLEIKFFDRLKALEKLETLVCGNANAGANALFSAIAQGAAALRTEKDDD